MHYTVSIPHCQSYAVSFQRCIVAWSIISNSCRNTAPLLLLPEFCSSLNVEDRCGFFNWLREKIFFCCFYCRVWCGHILFIGVKHSGELLSTFPRGSHTAVCVVTSAIQVVIWHKIKYDIKSPNLLTVQLRKRFHSSSKEVFTVVLQVASGCQNM